MEVSNNKIEESKKDIIKICGEQMSFAQTVSKDSNKITSSAMTLIGFYKNNVLMLLLLLNLLTIIMNIILHLIKISFSICYMHLIIIQ